jgi:hypothetical protein
VLGEKPAPVPLFQQQNPYAMAMLQYCMYKITSLGTYLGCSISYQFSNDVEFKLAKFLQLIDTIKRTIFKKVRRETILKLYNT